MSGEWMKIKDGYLLRNIADAWIIVPIGARIYDFNGIMTVNETGSFLWGKLKEGLSKQELVVSLINEYDVDTVTADNDVEMFLQSLIEGDVLEV